MKNIDWTGCKTAKEKAVLIVGLCGVVNDSKITKQVRAVDIINQVILPCSDEGDVGFWKQVIENIIEEK